MKTDKFIISQDLAGISSLKRIQAHDLSLSQCQQLRGIVCNNWMDHEDYKVGRPTGRFLQGYQEPQEGHEDGWVLIEFWSDEEQAINIYVDYINTQLGLNETQAG